MKAKKVHPLITHIERSLGKIDKAWKDKGEDLAISISTYKNQPCEGYTTLVSLGLSSHILKRGCREYRQELIFAIRNSIQYEDALDLLMGYAQFMVSKHQAMLRGEVIGPYAKPLLPGTRMMALYASCPVIFDDDLAVFEGSDPPTVFVWMIPIYAEEAEFIANYGWSKFEDILVDKDPNLLDFHRESVV